MQASLQRKQPQASRRHKLSAFSAVCVACGELPRERSRRGRWSCCLGTSLLRVARLLLEPGDLLKGGAAFASELGVIIQVSAVALRAAKIYLARHAAKDCVRVAAILDVAGAAIGNLALSVLNAIATVATHPAEQLI